MFDSMITIALMDSCYYFCAGLDFNPLELRLIMEKPCIFMWGFV